MTFPNDPKEYRETFNTFYAVSIFGPVDSKHFLNHNKTLVKIINHTYECYKITSDIHIGNLTVFNYTYFLTVDSIPFVLSGISLSYKSDSESFSLIHSLYKNKQIDHLIFSLDYITNSIHFGGVPNNTMPYVGHCDIDKKQPYWGCNLTRIKIKMNNSEPRYYIYIFLFNISICLFQFLYLYICKKIYKLL